MEVGTVAAVLPDALRFCFALAAEDTVARGASLEIVETPGRARCRACGADVALDRPYGRCACGGSDLAWLSRAAPPILAREGARHVRPPWVPPAARTPPPPRPSRPP